MKKIYLMSLLFLIIDLCGFSQVQLTEYFLDKTLYNPAFTGTSGGLSANGYLRDQWMGLTDPNRNRVEPVSTILNFHAPVYALNSGIGINLVYNKLGFEKNTGVKLNYAYFIPLPDKNASLSIGIGVSLLSKSIDYSRLIPEQPGDPLINSSKIERGFIPDIDFGIQYQKLNKFYMGISTVNLIRSSADIASVRYSPERYYYLTAGYYIKLKENRKKVLYLIPSALVKSDLLNMQIDLNAMIEYNSLYWGGVSWRYQDAVAVMAGINLKGIRIGASYDITTSYLSEASKGSFEFFVGYKHAIKHKVQHSYNFNTRYL